MSIPLYRLTFIFPFPSFAYCLAIPPLEAMACGAPVITSNTSSLPEVVGDAALLVDPHDVKELGHAITRLLEDEQLREELRQKGYQRARQYTCSPSPSKLLSVSQKLYTAAITSADEVT